MKAWPRERGDLVEQNAQSIQWWEARQVDLRLWVGSLHFPTTRTFTHSRSNGITEMLYEKNAIPIVLRHKFLTELIGFELNFSASVTFSVKGKYHYKSHRAYINQAFRTQSILPKTVEDHSLLPRRAGRSCKDCKWVLTRIQGLYTKVLLLYFASLNLGRSFLSKKAFPFYIKETVDNTQR